MRVKVIFLETISYSTRAMAIYHDMLPRDHPLIASCMRNISICHAKLGNANAAAAAVQAAAVQARRSQVQCAAAGCPRKVKVDGSSLDQCSGCKRTHYCSVVCQSADWKAGAGHKAECKALAAPADE